jgi:hypothetical protein
MDWVAPQSPLAPGIIETCLIVSESNNHADNAVGFILNVVKFSGD